MVRPLFRPETNHTCHEKSNPFRETVPLTEQYLCQKPWILADPDPQHVLGFHRNSPKVPVEIKIDARPLLPDHPVEGLERVHGLKDGGDPPHSRVDLYRLSTQSAGHRQPGTDDRCKNNRQESA